MKNFLIMLLPLSIIIALFAYFKNEELSYNGFLMGIRQIEFTLPNIDKISETWNQIESTTKSFRSGGNNVFDYVKNIFSIVRYLGVLTWNATQFIIELINEAISNIIKVLRFIYDYFIN